MKNLIILLTIVIAPIVGFTQDKPIESFMGIKFGATKQSAMAIAKSRKGIINPRMTTPINIGYTNIKFADRETFSVNLGFVNNKFYEGHAFFKITNKAKVFELYNEIFDELKEVYGDSKQEERDYKYPYSEGDKEAWVAVTSGYATISDTWIDEKTKGGIKLFIMDGGELIALWYQHSELQKEAKKIKPKKDY